MKVFQTVSLVSQTKPAQTPLLIYSQLFHFTLGRTDHFFHVIQDSSRLSSTCSSDDNVVLIFTLNLLNFYTMICIDDGEHIVSSLPSVSEDVGKLVLFGMHQRVIKVLRGLRLALVTIYGVPVFL